MKNFKKVLSLALAVLMVIGGLVIAPVDAKADTTYTQVTSVSEVKTGDYVVLVESGGKYYAMSTETSSNGKYFQSVAVTVDGNSISSESAVPVWKITNTDGEYSFNNGTGYLGYVAEKQTELASSESNTTKWNITASTEKEGAFLINPVADATPTYLAYNASSPRFVNYKATSNQNDNIYLYAVDGAEETTDYYLIGYINGANYGCDGDWENLGDYKFVDGKVTVEFEQASYVFVKTGDNESWYMTNGWLGEELTEATLYNTSTLGDNGNKLYVPAGKYELTLVDNGDDTFTLSYEEVKELTPEQIVEAAYALESGKSLEGTQTLTGVVTYVDTAYSEKYSNVSVTIKIGNLEDKQIICYQMKGTGADVIGIGDEITVTGTLTNYNGTIEFAKGCNLDSYVDNADPTPADIVVAEDATDAEIIAKAHTLVWAQSIEGTQTLEGVVKSIDSAYSSKYGNITITMTVDGKDIQCYRLVGTGADVLAVNDTVEVSGTIHNYKGTIQFLQGCEIVVEEDDTNEDGNDNTTSTMEQIVKDAYALESGKSLEGTQTLTGIITYIDTEYSDSYKNITVTIKVGNLEDKQIMCYRMKGDGADKIGIGDEITVTGTLTNFNGTIEFKAGCSLDKVVDNADPTPADITVAEDATDAEIIAKAHTLAWAQSIVGTQTLEGVIKAIDTAYDEEFENITVTMTVDGKDIQCYRLKGTGAKDLAVGNTIEVSGEIHNYKGTIRFLQGCVLVVDEEEGSEAGSENDSTTESGSESEKETEVKLSAAEIMALAEALEEGKSLEGTYKLQGVITEIGEYNEQYKDVSLTIKVNGTDKTIYCYCVKGEGNDVLKVGDEIAVEGTIKNYKGTIEFEKPQLVPIDAKGDFSPVAVCMILVAGAAFVAVGVASKKRMA